LDRTRLSPVPFPALEEKDAVPKRSPSTDNKQNKSQESGESGNQELDPLAEEQKQQEHDNDDEELQDSTSSKSAEHSHSEEAKSSEMEISLREPHSAINTEQTPSDDERDSSMEEGPQDSSCVNHDDTCLNNDKEHLLEDTSREYSGRPLDNESEMAVEMEMNEQNIPTAQESPRPPQDEVDMSVKAEDKQQCICMPKNSPQSLPSQDEIPVNPEEEEQNSSPPSPAQKGALAEHKTIRHPTENGTSVVFPKDSFEKEYQDPFDVKYKEQSFLNGADGSETDNEDSFSIAGVVNLSQPSVAPPADESVQKHKISTPKPSSTQNEYENASEATKEQATTESGLLGADFEGGCVYPGAECEKKDGMREYDEIDGSLGAIKKTDESPDSDEPVIEVARTFATLPDASKPMLPYLNKTEKAKEVSSSHSSPRPQKTPALPKGNVKPCVATAKETSFVSAGCKLDQNSGSTEKVQDAKDTGEGSSPFSYVSTLSPDSRASPLNLSHFRTSCVGKGPATSERMIEKQISERIGGDDGVLNNQVDEAETETPHAALNDERFDSQVDLEEYPLATSNEDGLDSQSVVEGNPDGEYVAETEPSIILPEVTLSHSLRNAVDDIGAPMWEFSPEEALKPVPRKRRRRSESKSARKNLPFGSPRMSIRTRGSVKRKLIDLTEFKTPPLQEYGGTERKRRARDKPETEARVAQPMVEHQGQTTTRGEDGDTARQSFFGQMTSSSSV
jgi:hypothetical protein